jgi:hypothetical protein
MAVLSALNWDTLTWPQALVIVACLIILWRIFSRVI